MKKKVNVLLMEPKSLLMDLTKKAIQSKPDDSYDITIVGTATTAKAGYFELYKHRPHILFLNPELEDEDGLSFIQHALERMPHLKIVVMATRLLDKQAFLDSGAHAVVHVPIQRASLWRKIDQLIEEVNAIGLLDVAEYVPEEDESPSTPKENLFELELDDRPAFTPIFEEMRNKKDEEGNLVEEKEEEQPPNIPNDNPPYLEVVDEDKEIDNSTLTIDVMDDVVLVDELVEPPTQGESNENELLIVEDEEPTRTDLSDDQKDESKDNDSEDELIVFDPFAFSPSTEVKKPEEQKEENATEEDSDQHELFTFDPPSIEIEEGTPSEEKKEDNFSIFTFDTEVPDDVTEEAVVPEGKNTGNDSTIPLFDVKPNSNEEIEVEVEPGKASEVQQPAIEFPTIELPPVDVRDERQEVELHDSPFTENTPIEPQAPEPLFLMNDELEEVEKVEITVIDKPKVSSNEPRTENSLYFAGAEYNKSTLKERRSFDSGFYNRNGEFVPLYPPREQFARNTSVNFSEADVETNSESTFSNPQETKPEESLFSSVKKLFRRH